MKQDQVQIVEVGLRDGLQNEKSVISTEIKIELAQKLIQARVQRFEAGAFVSAQWVPQMADSREVIEQIQALQRTKALPRKLQYSVLVPNEAGMKKALDLDVPEVAVFASATESFSLKNINCSIKESFHRFRPVFELAKKNKVRVRGYLSVCFGCPYEGKVSEEKVVKLAIQLHQLGCFEISIGDTIGVATPGQIESLFKKLKKVIPVRKLAGHFHDTRGQALANILTAYKIGVRVFDSSLGGLGGCPYAPGAAGNVATEDVAYMFQGMQVKTGIQLEPLIEASRWMGQKMNRPLPSLVSRAGLLIPQGRVKPALN